MSKCIRIGIDTPLTYNVPIRVMGARLVHTGATTANIYDYTSASDATKKKIALATTDTILSDNAVLPKDGILFTEGCFIDWVAAGEVFLYVKE